jgi:hypothetical protein
MDLRQHTLVTLPIREEPALYSGELYLYTGLSVKSLSDSPREALIG